MKVRIRNSYRKPGPPGLPAHPVARRRAPSAPGRTCPSSARRKTKKSSPRTASARCACKVTMLPTPPTHARARSSRCVHRQGEAAVRRARSSSRSRPRLRRGRAPPTPHGRPGGRGSGLRQGAHRCRPATQPTAKVSGRNVTVNWTAPGGAVPARRLRRQAPLNGGGTEADDRRQLLGHRHRPHLHREQRAPGTWQYTVTPARQNWRGSESRAEHRGHRRLAQR